MYLSLEIIAYQTFCTFVYLYTLYYFLWIDFQKRNHWGKLCEHFYDFCWQIAYLPAKYEKISIILFSFISKEIILPLNKNSSLKNVNTLLFSFVFLIFSTFWVLFFPELAVHKFACWYRSVFLIILYTFSPGKDVHCVANNSFKHLVHGVLLAFKSILKYDLCNRKWYSTVNVFEMEIKNLSEGHIKHL